ncbi:response regulator [Thiocystis violacea]|uniref:response regulator n=1 Tax=Thiocystis violacea TaxID=13725 RepID=UPI0019032AEA|nr:response regulator [Thiocystis violacea]
MIRVEAEAITSNAPLPHAVFTCDGALLASQGAKVYEEEKLEILKWQGWCQRAPIAEAPPDGFDTESVTRRPPIEDDGLRLTASLPAPLERTTALVADDLPLARKLLTDILTDQGVRRVIPAEDGKQAISRFFNDAPNLVFLDIDMPNLDGLGALRQIKSWSPDAFVCLISASSTRENVRAARDYQVDGFLVKPFSILNLRRVLEKYQARLPSSAI